jgi:hypothetical protein
LPLAAAALACNLPQRQATQEPVPTWALPSRLTATALASPLVSTGTVPPEPDATVTAGPAATATPGSPPPLAAGEYRAARAEAPPDVDGALGDWAELPYSAERPVFGQGNWQGTEDLSAAWNAAWDDEHLYLAVEVRDDALVQQASGELIFRGDSVELLLDADPLGDAGVRRLNEDDFQLGFSPGGQGEAEAYLWFPQAEARALSDVPLASEQTDGGYRLEAAVPWSLFGITPEAGRRFGFALSISDDDTAASPEQESMVSSAPGRVLTDPTSWGVLELGS